MVLSILIVALGAGANASVFSVVRGLAIGAPLAIATTRVMRGLLFAVRPDDANTIVTVSTLVAVTTVAATVIPAWRARQVDLVNVLRAE